MKEAEVRCAMFILSRDKGKDKGTNIFRNKKHGHLCSPTQLARLRDSSKIANYQ